MYLMSACLGGVNCKYNGGNNLRTPFLKMINDKKVVLVCPENLGGLPTPRPACEIMDGGGQEVLEGHKRVINRDGRDVTKLYLKGAYKTLNIANVLGIKHAILKSRSPACGSGQVYDGSFNSVLREGDGVAAALLKAQGIEVINDEDFLDNLGQTKQSK